MATQTHAQEAESSANPNRQVLESCLLSMNAKYQELLVQPGALDQAREAGRTVRHLAQCIADSAISEDLEDESEDEAELDVSDL